MLIGNEPKPVTWQLANEANAVRRLVRKLEREAPGPRVECLQHYNGTMESRSFHIV